LVTAAVEMDGSKAETPVEFLGGHRSFRPVNLLDEPAHSGEEKTLRASPYEISTVRLPVK
jgi:hypothetical protein